MATTFNKLNTNQAGVDLGLEEYGWADFFSGGSRDASSTITFNTNGTVTFSGSGDIIDLDTSPATNWNTNGGSYLSYETISFTLGTSGSATVTGGLASSTFLGENRHNLGSAAFVISVSSSLLVNQLGNRNEQIYIKVSIWDSASGGRRTAYGSYNASAFVGSSI